MSALIKKNRILVNNIGITYYVLGRGKPLLFLHGGRVNALTFKNLLVLLAKDYTVYAPDIPGHGDSDTPQKVWSFTDYASCFTAFLAQLSLHDVTVVGYSMGGGIALNMLSPKKEIAQRYIIDASGVESRSATPIRIFFDRVVFIVTHPLTLPTTLLLARDYLLFCRKHLHDWKHIQQIRKRCLSTSYDENFKKILSPTSILWGEKDIIYSPAIGRELSKKIAQATFSTVPGNHDWLLYYPRQILRYLV